MSDVWWGPSSWFEDECVLDVSLPGGKSAPISFSSYNGTNPIMGLHPHDLIKTQLPTKTPPQLGGSRFQHTNLEEGRQIAVHTSPIQDLNPHLGKACFIMTCWWCLSWGWEGGSRGRGQVYTYGWFMLIYRQKPGQHCNAIICQLKININFKNILFSKGCVCTYSKASHRDALTEERHCVPQTWFSKDYPNFLQK